MHNRPKLAHTNFNHDLTLQSVPGSSVGFFRRRCLRRSHRWEVAGLHGRCKTTRPAHSWLPTPPSLRRRCTSPLPLNTVAAARVLGLGIAAVCGCNWGTGWGRGTCLNSRGRSYPFREGIWVHTQMHITRIRLQIGPIRCRAYTVAWLKLGENYNGASIVLRVVMARFKNGKIIMAPT